MSGFCWDLFLDTTWNYLAGKYKTTTLTDPYNKIMTFTMCPIVALAGGMHKAIINTEAFFM